MNKLRKTFTISVMAITVLVMSAVVVPDVGAAASAGDLIKMDGLSSVYYLADDGKRYVFPNESTFFSWYGDFSSVVTIPQSELEGYPLGANVTMRPGTNLVKITTNPNVYAVEASGTLVLIPDESTAIALYGADWATRVVDIADSFFTNYTISSDELTSAAYPSGSLISLPDDSDVYYIDADGTARKIADETAFLANRFSWDDVITTSDTFTLPTTGDEITGADSDSNSLDLTDTSQGGGSGSGIQPGAGTGVVVALASDTPASGTAVQSAARVPFTAVNITASNDGDVSVKLKVQRNGLSVDADFPNIIFLEGINQVGNLKTLNSNHQCLSDSISVSAGTTKTITIAANIKTTATSAGTANFSLVDVTTTASVSGSLPIVGNDMSLSNAVTIGTATLAAGSYGTGNTATKEVGTTNYTFIDFKITATTEAQQVEYIKFTNQGSVADTDLANVVLHVDNAEYMTGSQVSKKVEFDLSSNPVAIAKGTSVEFALLGDIIGGSGRNIDFDIDKTTDVAVKGMDFGYYITPSAALNAGNIITVSAGTLTISKSNEVATGNIAEGESNVAVGAFNFKAQGEQVNITQAIFKVDVAGTGNEEDVTNCALYDENGDAVTGAVDPELTTATTTFTDTISVPIGDNIYTMKCNLNTDFADSDTITVTAALGTASNWTCTGETTGDAITEAPTSAVAANVQTIKAGSLASYTSATPVAQSLVKGTSQALFANILLDGTASGEAIKVTQMVITNTPASGAKAFDITNIKLYVDGSPLSVIKNGSTATANTAENFTFSLSGSDAIIVPKAGSVTVQVKGDISASAATGDHVFDLNSLSAKGDDTGTTVTSTPSGSGQAMTIVANGTLTTSIDSSNPDASLIAAGSTGVTMTVLKMEATYEDIELDTILLTRDVTTAASSSVNDYLKLYLYDEDGNKIVETSPTAVDAYTVSVPDYSEDGSGNWVSGFKVTNEDSNGAKLYVKADFASIGTGLGGTSLNQVGWKVNTAADVVATGLESGQGATETGAANSNTHYIYKSVPTVAILSLPTTTLSNGTPVLFKFSVTADAQGDIELREVSYTIATTGVTVTGLKTYDVTGTSVELNATGDEVVAASGLVSCAFDAAKSRTIAAGTTRTFELKGTVTGASTGDSITTQLNGDAALATNAPGAYAGISADGGGNHDFIWSDMNKSSHDATTLDWTNGYLVSGLNSTVSDSGVLGL